MEVEYLFRTVTIPFGVVVEGHNFVFFWLKWCHKMEGGWGLVWNSSFGSMISHTTFYRNKKIFNLVFNITPVLYVLPFLTICMSIFGPVSYNNVTNVKYKLLCVRFYILIFVFFGFVCWNGYRLDSIHFLIAKWTITHSCNSALICQFPILSKRLTPTLKRSVRLNCKLCLCIILL